MQCCVGTVVYNSALMYFDSFLESLSKQDSKDFRLIVVNDDCDASIITGMVEGYFSKDKFLLINTNACLKPYELRIELIKLAKTNGFDLLILGDSDDWFSDNRISLVIKDFLDNPEYTIFYNCLEKPDGSVVLSDLPPKTESIDCILECNYLGLSNTAIALNNITFSFIDSLYEGRTIVFDWYFFSRLLLAGYWAKRVNGAITYYRIHPNNVAGEPRGAKSSIQFEVDVKIEHYKLLSSYGECFKQLRDAYSNYTVLCEMNNNSELFWWSQLRRKNNEI